MAEPSVTDQDYQCLGILVAAANSQLGITVPTSNPTRARQAIYALRTKMNDPTFADLQIRPSPTNSEGEIWLIKLGEVNALTVDLRADISQG